MNGKSLGLCLGISLALGGSSCLAREIGTAQMTVQVTVLTTCRNAGGTTPGADDLRVTCTKNAPYDVDLHALAALGSETTRPFESLRARGPATMIRARAELGAHGLPRFFEARYAMGTDDAPAIEPRPAVVTVSY